MLTRSLSQTNPAHTLWSCFFMVCFNNILLSAPGPNKTEVQVTGAWHARRRPGAQICYIFLFLAALPLPGEGGGDFFTRVWTCTWWPCLCVGLQSVVFASCFVTGMLYAFVFSSLHATCSAHLTFNCFF